MTWFSQLNLVGAKDDTPVHFCDKCGLPIKIYGRMVREMISCVYKGKITFIIGHWDSVGWRRWDFKRGFESLVCLKLPQPVTADTNCIVCIVNIFLEGEAVFIGGMSCAMANVIMLQIVRDLSDKIGMMSNLQYVSWPFLTDSM